MEQDSLLAVTPEETLLPESTTAVPAPAFQPYIPVNAEEQALAITFANDDTKHGDTSKAISLNLDLIKQGKINDLIKPIVSQEQQSYIDVLSDNAQTAAQLGQTDRAMQTMLQHNVLLRSKIEADKIKEADAHAVVAGRALEHAAIQDPDIDRVPRVKLVKSLDEWRENFGLRNTLLAQIGKQSDPSKFDSLSYLAAGILPLVPLAYENVFRNVAERATNQKIPLSLNPITYVEKVYEIFIGLDESGRQALMRSIMEDEYGLFGQNEAAKQDFIRRLVAMTGSEGAAMGGMNAALGFMDVGMLLGYVVGKGIRQGLPAKSLKETAGPRTTGNLVADSITHHKAGPLGLNDAEATGAAIAAGEHPYTYNPASLEGLSPHVQDRLAMTWDQMVRAEKDRLATSGIPPEEVAVAIKAIENSYSPANDKGIYSIKFTGDVNEPRAKFTILMQAEDGKPFKTVEAAKAAARARGLADDAFEIVTEGSVKEADAAGARASITAFHGGQDFAKFRERFIGTGNGGDALGWGFYTSLTKDMAEWFARGRAYQGDKAALYEISLPDRKFFLDFDRGFTAQSSEVKQALARLLTPEEIKGWKAFDGRGIYRALSQRLGSAERASKALEQAGVVGNAGFLKGANKYKEFVVFSEDLMNKGLVRKSGIELPETIAEREARKAGELADDEAGAQLMAEYGQGDPVRASVASHKAFLQFPDSAKKQMSTNRIFENPTVGLFGKDAAPLQFSGAFDLDAEKYYTDILKLLGMEKENVLFVTRNDIDKLLSRVEFKTQFTRDNMKDAVDILRNQNGVYSRVTLVDGRKAHIIGIGDDPASLKGVFTGTHEIGHLFDFVYFNSLHAEKRVALMKDFYKWAQSKHGNADELSQLASRVFAPDIDRIGSFRVFEGMAKGTYKPLPHQVEHIEAMKMWMKSFDEYVAEQMSRWLTTDQRAVSIGERVWADWRDTLVEYFRSVIQIMQKFFGKEVMSVSPEQAFKQLMDEHLERVAKMRETGTLGGDPSGLDFTNVAAAIADIRGPAQPARKRAEPSKGGPAGPSRAPTEDYLLRVRMDDPINASGVYDPQDINSMPWIAADPRHGASVDAMTGRVVGVHQTARTRRDMTEMLKAPLSALSKKERERVLAVLEEGDQASFAGGYGKEFSASELLARGLTENEVEAYMTVRQARMLNYFIHNRAMVDSMRRKGLMEVEVYGQSKFAGKALPLEQAVLKNKAPVYDMATKAFVELEAATAYGEGKRLIHVPKGALVDGQEVTYFLAKDTEATVRKIHTALHYRPGEFARIYSDNYFIRMGVGKVTNGVKSTVEFPIRTAATEKEAMEFINAVVDGKEAVLRGASGAELEQIIGRFYSPEQFKNEVLTGELRDMTSLRFHFTREIDDYLGQTAEAHARAGKLFTRDRGEHLGTADRTRAARANILNPYESLSREVTMVSHFSNVTEWKEAQIGRWMATFGDMLGTARTGDDVVDFFKAAGATFSHVTGKRGLFAERTHRYIMRQVGIQTQEHKWWQSLMRRVGEGVMPYVGEGVGAVIRDANPLNFIRAVNHHFTLGLFNFSQLIVQANGMALAAAVHPIHGAKSAALYPAIRVALMSDNPEVWAKISKVAGEDVGRVAQAIRKSGLIDNLRSTSLHNIEDGKMDIFASMPRRALGTVIEKGAFFFNRGEEAARVIAFDIARREWEKLNPGLDFLSNPGMQWIMRKSDDYTMNMTRANLARWQEGVMSIPTQFLQYNIKFMQNIASGLITGGGKGRGFTRSEALKALAGSIAFYGSAGLGISKLVGEWIPDEVEEKMSPTVKTAIGQGVFAAALKAVGEATTGERLDVALGTRLGSINFFTDMVYDAFTDPKNIYEAMLGPTRATGERLAVIADIANLWRKQESVTLDEVGRAGLEIFAEQISSTRNFTKAYYIHQGNGVLRNRKGEPVADLSTPEVWAQAVGLSPSQAYDYYTMLDSKRAYFRALDGVADMIFSTQKKIIEARNAGDSDRVEKLEKALQLMWPQNYGDYMHVKAKVTKHLFPYDTQFQKLLVEHATKPGHYEKPFVTTKPER